MKQLNAGFLDPARLSLEHPVESGVVLDLGGLDEAVVIALIASSESRVSATSRPRLVRVKTATQSPSPTAILRRSIKLWSLSDRMSSRIQVGADLNTVRELLGHKSLKMTLRYADLSPSHKSKAIALINQALGSIPGDPEAREVTQLVTHPNIGDGHRL